MEYVDILEPPTFTKTGQVKSRQQAWQDGDWIGTFNLWIVQTQPVPALIYQQRSQQSSWAPGLLDVTAGGHYQAGETIENGLREVKEELGRVYAFKDLHYLGRKLHVDPDTRGHVRRNVVDIFMIVDNTPLDAYTLEPEEVTAIGACPLSELIQVHKDRQHSFTIECITAEGKWLNYTVTQTSFPYNWDNYHFKMALLAQRFVRGESDLIY